MSVILRPQWRQQPQGAVGINWANPITRGLSFVTLPGLGVELSGRIPPGSVSGTVRRDGSSLFFPSNGTTDNLSFGQRNPLGPLANSTIFAVAQTPAGLSAGGGGSSGDGLIGTGGNAIYCERASSGNDIYKLAVYPATTFTSGAEFTYRNDGGTLLQQRLEDATLNSNRPFAIAGVKSGTSHSIYTTSSVGTGTFGSGSTAFTNANQMIVGNDPADANSTWNGWIHLVAGWARSLSAAEIRSLQENPWQLFAPRRVLVPVSVASGGTSYTLTASAGSFAHNGTAASLLHGRKVAADSGTFLLGGVSSTFPRGYSLAADSGTFALTGGDVTSSSSYTMAALAGEVTLTGAEAALKRGRTLAASAASFTLTGQAATFPRTYRLTASAGTYTLTGWSASFPGDKAFQAAAGSFTATGGDASLRRGRLLSAEGGSVALTGEAAFFAWAHKLAADVAALDLVGGDATLIVGMAARSLPDDSRIGTPRPENRIAHAGFESRYAVLRN